MYKEIGEFAKNVGFDSRLYKDGEFWTAVLVAIGMGVWIHFDPSWIESMRTHFGDLLSITSIVFRVRVNDFVFLHPSCWDMVERQKG